jgi:hypothetical protein
MQLFASLVFVSLSGVFGSNLPNWAQLCSVKNLDCRKPLEFRNLTEWTPAPGDPAGHLRPLGHSDFDSVWDGHIKEFEDGYEMTAGEFWKNFHPNKPFVLRGAGKNHRAMEKWKDDQYIIDNFGHYKVKIENKNEDRLTDYCGLEKFGDIVHCESDVKPYVETYMNISRFMSRYRNPSKFDHYVVTQMPHDMQKDMEVGKSNIAISCS